MQSFRFYRQNRSSNVTAGNSNVDLARATYQVVLEQKNLRKWRFFSILVKVVFLLVIGAVVLGLFSSPNLTNSYTDSHTALIDIKGIIADGEVSSADNIIKALNVAVEGQNLQGIILNINSPGGSPVQSAQVFDEIKRLKALHTSIPIYAVINDIGASGAYYIASATDKIYVNKNSLVGSIGVISQSFGLDKFINEYKITRRTMQAGDNKDFLDPFAPESEKHKQYWQNILNATHASFIQDVLEGRGSRVNSNNSELFSGLIYTGKQAINNGLADEIGNYFFVAREVIQEENIVKFELEQDPVKNWISNIGSSFINSLTTNFFSPLLI